MAGISSKALKPNYAENKYRYNGKEQQNREFSDGSGLELYDYGGRTYDAQIGRFQNIDREAQQFFEWSPYSYVRDNPILRLDPSGNWDITVHVYHDRQKYGYGIAVIKDRKGNEVFRFTVRAEGVGGRNRLRSNSDTPLGTYDIPSGKDKWITGGSRLSYGPNARLRLEGESGEIIVSGRSLIRIHGGRQEQYNEETGTWSEIKNAGLKKTHGCLRALDADMKSLKNVTDKLEANDSKENGGKLTVIDDLVDVNGTFVLPNTKKETFQEYFQRIMDNAEKAIQTTKELIKKTEDEKKSEEFLEKSRRERNSILW
jgi:RHS repeat-associated protein